MAKLVELSPARQAETINAYTKRSLTFRALDHCANLARQTGNWNVCVRTIHERNMTMLGKVREGYPPAVWIKGWHEIVIVNEHATLKNGDKIHVRKLCDRGYRYFPVNLKGE